MSDIRYGRKRNGITKQLNDKLTEWVETIDDEHLVKLIKKNTIVTGGSIASMLLGESVNDYDVYFRDYETTVAVANYYVNKFNDAQALLVKEGVIPYKPEVKTFSDNNDGFNTERVSIHMKSAGVAAEDQETYDYFECSTPEAVAAFAESLQSSDKSVRPRYRPIFLSENAITLANDVQIVIRFYGEPDVIHSNYDFAHAMCYYDWDEKKLVLPAEALECLLSRTLIYRGSLFPIASIFRMKKFLERGWRISAGQQLKIMWQISELDLTDYKVIKEQLTGVDQAYLHQLVSALKTVDPTTIDSTYIASIIDKIFD